MFCELSITLYCHHPNPTGANRYDWENLPRALVRGVDGRPWSEGTVLPPPPGLQFGRTRGSMGRRGNRWVEAQSSTSICRPHSHPIPLQGPAGRTQVPGLGEPGSSYPSPLRPRGPRPPAGPCRRHAQAGGTGLPVEEVQDDFGHGGGELQVEFWGRTGVVALREPSPDE